MLRDSLLSGLLLDGGKLRRHYEPVGDALRAACAGAWYMQEESDGSTAVPRLDASPNGRNLVDINTCKSGTGLVGRCLEPTPADRDCLELTTANLNSNYYANSHWWCGWVFLKSNVFMELCCGSNTFMFTNRYRSGETKFSRFDAWSGGNTEVLWSATAALNTWYFLVAGRDVSAIKSFLSVNAAPIQESSASSGTPSIVATSTMIGNRLYTSFDSNNAKFQHWYLFSGLPTAEQIAYMYNDGVPLELF